MVDVSSMLLWSVADTLGIEITYDRQLGRIRGEGSITVDLFGLKVNFHSRVVSSHVLKDRSVLLFVRVKGNFCLFVRAATARPRDAITVSYLNLAKLDGRIEGWLEAIKPKSADECARLLEPAIVASFTKEKKTWKRC